MLLHPVTVCGALAAASYACIEAFARGAIVSPVWPPAGIALAAALLAGPRVLPAVAAGVLAGNLLAGSGAAASVLSAASNTFEAMAGAWLVRRYAGGPHAFERVATTARFFPALLPAPLLGATLGTIGIWLQGGEAGAQVWVTWALGDIMGAWVFAPPVLAWLTPAPVPAQGRRWEAALLALALAAIGLGGYAGGAEAARAPPASGFLFLPFLLWGTFRFGLRGAAGASCAVAVVAVAATLAGRGPFAQPGVLHPHLWLQVALGLFSVAGMLLGAAVVELRLARLRLADAAHSLEAEVQRRTRAHEEAQRRLAVTERLGALGTLASGVGHEVRTPLTFIRNNLATLGMRLRAEPGLPPGLRAEAERLLASSDKGVQRIDRLVHQLREFAKPAVHPERDGLRDVVAEAIELWRATHRGDVELAAALEDTPVVVVDRGEVQQVVINLLNNAAEAMGGRGRLDVRVGSDATEARIEVEDHGPGIPSEVQERLWDPFYTTKPTGTGLGLSISRRIVEAHGGHLDFATRAGHGTTFRVHLPLGRAEAAA